MTNVMFIVENLYFLFENALYRGVNIGILKRMDLLEGDSGVFAEVLSSTFVGSTKLTSGRTSLQTSSDIKPL